MWTNHEQKIREIGARPKTIKTYVIVLTDINSS
jgi:hypothetical protein